MCHTHLIFFFFSKVLSLNVVLAYIKHEAILKFLFWNDNYISISVFWTKVYQTLKHHFQQYFEESLEEYSFRELD